MSKRLLERSTGEAKRSSSNRRAEDVESAHGELEAVAGRAKPPIRLNTAALEFKRGQRMGAITSMRSTIEKPGSSGKTRKAETPRAPASPVRANTV